MGIPEKGVTALETNDYQTLSYAYELNPHPSIRCAICVNFWTYSVLETGVYSRASQRKG